MSRVTFVMVAVLIASHASWAIADETPRDVPRVLKSYENGKAAFRVLDYDAAIVHFREAYLLSRDATYLYNIALAYQHKKDLVQAIAFYKSYLRDAPEADNAAKVRARLAQLEQEAAARAAPPPPLAATTKPRASLTPPLEPRATRFGPLRIAAVTTAGAGLAIVATGAVFALRASSAERELEDARAAHAPWTDALAATHEQGRRDAELSKLAFGVGAGLVVVGGALYLLGVHADRRSVEIVPIISRAGAGIQIVGRF